MLLLCSVVGRPRRSLRSLRSLWILHAFGWLDVGWPYLRHRMHSSHALLLSMILGTSLLRRSRSGLFRGSVMQQHLIWVAEVCLVQQTPAKLILKLDTSERLIARLSFCRCRCVLCLLRSLRIGYGFLLYRCKVRMSVQIICIPFRRRDLDLLYFRKVIFVVQTISQYVAKVPQCSLQCICCSLLLCLLKGRCFALAVLNVPVSDVLVKRPIS